ncbi:hypothetical protein [uncultured Gammaproteobacteria bacterium]|nr:hypothetical protein [uncultured Gammaproteobacteria bacterium]CAC9971057.1 hypothetical protein [uncultured Gammaproteobacteria bacterium]CAC9978060.1 hypothetical protein [uncultured Gammaproteobacteria bacterium]
MSDFKYKICIPIQSVGTRGSLFFKKTSNHIKVTINYIKAIIEFLKLLKYYFFI